LPAKLRGRLQLLPRYALQVSYFVFSFRSSITRNSPPHYIGWGCAGVDTGEALALPVKSRSVNGFNGADFRRTTLSRGIQRISILLSTVFWMDGMP
jgi:hypothetical protein